MASEARSGKQKAAIQLTAMHREEVDLVRRVGAAHVTAGGAAGCEQADDDGVSSRTQPPPLDLNPPQPTTDLKREIRTAMVGHRPQYGHAQLHGRKHDRLLGDGSLGVRRHVHTNICSHEARTETGGIQAEREARD
jgi:hypothetical protein